LYLELANNQSTYVGINGAGLQIGPAGNSLTNWTYHSSANVWSTNVGISAVANVTGGNLGTGGTVSATGNVTGGNIKTNGLISATGTITGGNLATGGTASATGTITGGNLATGGTASATGTITGGNVLTAGLISATGTITGGNLSIGGTTTLTGVATAPTAANGTSNTQIATTAFVMYNGVPSGGIIMWSGAIISIPSGWYLCDGTNGTPNLQDRFIVGAGNAYFVGATGGSTDATLVSHTHTATSSVTDPGHSHISDSNGAPNGGGAGAALTYGQGNHPGHPTLSASTGISIATTVSTEGSSATNANLPPYYALAYIMKA
jgi:hypothetical protein